MKSITVLKIALILYVTFAQVVQGSGKHKRRVHVRYPVKLLAPITGSYFSSNVTRDRMICFGNRDYNEPTYIQTVFCMFAMLPLPFVSDMLSKRHNSTQSLLSLASCNGIWGSRSVIVDAYGSVEFLKVGRLPAESNFIDDNIALNATRWLELPNTFPKQHQREIKQIPAEPIYLCARSNDWMGENAHFSISFRPVYIRERDKTQCMKKTLLHIAFLLAVSSMWLLPYLAALVVAAVTFALGINKFMVALGFSCCFVCMAPLMLTKKNRHLASLYFKYFFTRIQAEETRMVIQQRLPVFQSLFFSSAVMCVGSAGSYIIYSYFGIDRETRNTMLKITMGISSSWFVFFLCRSFERFFRDWLWLAMSVGLAQLLDVHLNPLSRDEMMVVTILISFIFKKSLPKILHLARRNARMNRILTSIMTISSTSLVQHLGEIRANGASPIKVLDRDDSVDKIEELMGEPFPNHDLDASRISTRLSEEDYSEDDDDDDGREAAAESISRRVSPFPEAQSSENNVWLSEATVTPRNSISVSDNRRILSGELGEDLSSFALFSPHKSKDSYDAVEETEVPHRRKSFDSLNVGHRSVTLSVLGPLVIDETRIWIPLATADMGLLKSAQRGLSTLGTLQSKEYAPLADYRRIIAYASFVSINAAASFRGWSQQRGNLDVLLSLANNSDNSVPSTVELVNISPRVSGRKITFFFKFAPIAYPNKSTAGRCILSTQRVLVAIKEQFSSIITSVQIDPASVSMGPCTEFYSHVGVQCDLNFDSLAHGSELIAGESGMSTSKLLGAHKTYQKLAQQTRHNEVSESSRAIMSTVSALLTAIGFENYPCFDAANFEIDLVRSTSSTSGERSDRNKYEGSRDMVGVSEVVEGDEADEADVSMMPAFTGASETPSPNPASRYRANFSQGECTEQGSGVTLFLSIPLLFNSLPSLLTKRERRESVGPGGIEGVCDTEATSEPGVSDEKTAETISNERTSADKCLHMLLGHSGCSSEALGEDGVNMGLTKAVALVTAAAYIGFLWKFSNSIYYKASTMGDEKEEDMD